MMNLVILTVATNDGPPRPTSHCQLCCAPKGLPTARRSACWESASFRQRSGRSCHHVPRYGAGAQLRLESGIAATDWRLGTYATSLGQEAVGVGVASGMRPEDVLLPSYRDNAALLLRGVKLTEILLFWGGDERGSCWSGPAHDFPFCIPVGSQAPHAAGVAYAFKYRNEARVAVCILGDGATSKGDVSEALNFAGVFKLPVVFVVNNNQWAISVPLRRQTAAQTLAQKAIAAGFAGEQVDGNDVIAVRAAVDTAIAAARAGGGPHLIEAVTYRLGDHTTADDASRYRSADEVQEHWREEPLGRLRAYLVKRFNWNKAQEEEVTSECNQHVDAAIELYLHTAPRASATMFDHLYAKLPSIYAAQRKEVEDQNA